MKVTMPYLLGTLMCLGCSKLHQVSPEAETRPRSATYTVAPGDFTLAVIPDTQYYADSLNGGKPAMFRAQMQWIRDHQTDSNIVYVIGLGDISDHGDDPAWAAMEWGNATSAYYKLDSAGIPYGVAVGNHDQYPNTGFSLSTSCTTIKFNQYFGRSHFAGRSYYGGAYTKSGLPADNDCHYDLFSAGGLDFIVIYIEYDSHDQNTAGMNQWAYDLLGTYASRKAIIVTHYMMNPGDQGTFGPQGQGIYDKLKDRRNVFMFLGGHVGSEGKRQDTYNGRTIKTFLTDYQFTAGGGNGYLRLYKISVNRDLITATTYSPYLGTYGFAQFTRTLFHEQTTTRNCDLNQDGKTEQAFFNNGVYKVYGAPDVTVGQAGDIPVPADYDGDGKAEMAVWRPSTGEWIINGVATQYGTTGDIPVPGDYDGDGKADMAVWRPSDGTWYRRGIGNFVYGASGDVPIPGDYNGDGKTDIAVWRPSDGTWYVNGGNPAPLLYGQAGDIPAPGDYFGDGKTHVAVYRAGTWFVRGGTNATFGNVPGGDQLLALPYSIRQYYFP